LTCGRSLGLGASIARTLGNAADYLAAAALIALGTWMLLSGDIAAMFTRR
jgi:hypothetical protein